MKCPYCKNELTEGFINRPDSTFQFFPGDLRPNFFRTKWHVTKNAILIKPYKKREFRFNYSKVPAKCCLICRKIILDIDITKSGIYQLSSDEYIIFNNDILFEKVTITLKEIDQDMFEEKNNINVFKNLYNNRFQTIIMKLNEPYKEERQVNLRFKMTSNKTSPTYYFEIINDKLDRNKDVINLELTFSETDNEELNVVMYNDSGQSIFVLRELEL